MSSGDEEEKNRKDYEMETKENDLLFETFPITSTPAEPAILHNGEVKLKDKGPISYPKALKILLQSLARKEFPSDINRNMCLVVNIAEVGEDFRDGNAWNATKGKDFKIYHIEGTGKDMKVLVGKSE